MTLAQTKDRFTPLHNEKYYVIRKPNGIGKRRILEFEHTL